MFIFRAVQVVAAGILSLEVPNPGAVMDIDLTHAKMHLLAIHPDRMSQGVGWRGFIKKDCDGMVGGTLWKRVCPQDGRYFKRCAHHDADRCPGISKKACL